MEWIKVTDRLPNNYERVLVWVKYENETEFQWDDAELGALDSECYIEPNSGASWLIGMARNYVITHWACPEGPK